MESQLSPLDDDKYDQLLELGMWKKQFELKWNRLSEKQQEEIIVATRKKEVARAQHEEWKRRRSWDHS